jgi:hypothetical protein
MTRTTVKNLKICIVQLLVTEALAVILVVLGDNLPLEIYPRVIAPISLLTVVPIWALRDGAYAAFLVIVLIDVVFLSIMIFSIAWNHKIVGGICLFAFNFLSVGFIYTY